MAKSGFWLRGARGKLAGASIGKGSQGGTVIREIVTPKNPKTTAQMIQRIIWTTITQAYSKLKELCDHSFEGYSNGSECQQRFMKLNVHSLRSIVGNSIQAGVDASAIYDFIPVGSTELAHNTYIIAQGTLPSITLGDDEADAVSNVLPALENTYAGVAEALGLQRGDQVTLIQIANINGTATLKYARVILDPMDDGVAQEMSTAFIDDGAINCPSPRNDGEFERLEYDSELGGVSFALTSTNNTVLAAAAIASRLSGTEWQRSNSSLKFKLSAGTLYSLSEALAMTNAGVQTLSDLYLDNAGQGSVANFEGGGSGSVSGISSVFVNGTAISSSETTNIALRTNNTIIINVRNAEPTTQVAYRVNGGNWVNASAASGSASFSNNQLAEDDVINFAIGTASGGTFAPTRVRTGSATIIVPPGPSISAVTVGGTSIPNSGSTNVSAGSNVAINITTQDATEDLYASYKIGNGSWATPVAVANNAAALTANLAVGNSVSFAIGSGDTSANFTPSQTWGGTANVPTPAMTAVTVGGTSIANSGTTDVNAGSNVAINITTSNAYSGLYASYKIGSGSWATPVAVANNAASLTANLAVEDTVSFAIGSGATSANFTPSQTWGGTANVPNATISAVSVGGTSIASSGSTNVAAGSNLAVEFTTVNISGKYASYKIGNGSWATPVAVANNAASLTIPTLAVGDSVSFAIGTGTTSEAFTAEITYGGTATGITPPVFYPLNLNSNAFNADVVIDHEGYEDMNLTGHYSGTGSRVAWVRSATKPTTSTTGLSGSITVTKEDFNSSGITYQPVLHDGNKFWLIAGEATYSSYLWQFTNIVDIWDYSVSCQV